VVSGNGSKCPKIYAVCEDGGHISKRPCIKNCEFFIVSYVTKASTINKLSQRLYINTRFHLYLFSGDTNNYKFDGKNYCMKNKKNKKNYGNRPA
jgi:hypothetical protein